MEENVLKINKLDAFIELGKLNRKSTPVKRNQLVTLNALITDSIDKEYESKQFKEYFEFSNNNKKFLTSLGIKPINRNTRIINRNVFYYLKKLILFLWR